MEFLKVFIPIILMIVLAITWCITTNSRGEKQASVGRLLTTVILGNILIVVLQGIVIINTGTTGVVIRFGAMTNRTLSEGIHLVTPMVETVEVMSTQVHSYRAQCQSASNDMQTVNTEVILNYQLEEARCKDIYRRLRKDYDQRVIIPAIQESVKAATARYDAEQLINQREGVRTAIKQLLVAKLTQPYGIDVIDVSITNFSFLPEFNQAIEAKAKATQEAETAKRNLEKVKMEQAAQIEIAKAQAESLRLQKQNVTPELVRLRQIEVNKAAIEKWDGKLPQNMYGGAVPFINVK